MQVIVWDVWKIIPNRVGSRIESFYRVENNKQEAFR